MLRFILAFFLFAGTSVGAFAQSLPVPSYWLNQRGSEMKLYAMGPQGNFTGVYINHAAGFSCQGTPFNLVGRTAGHRLWFVVVWKNATQDCRSTTYWHGRLYGRTIHSRWLLVGAGIHPPLRGTDVFQQQP
jgi:hypothetical protein